MLLLSLVLILAGLVWAVHERRGAGELEVQKMQRRDAVRDGWMRAHQSELMKRIETRR